MKIEEIKKKMYDYVDFFGGQLSKRSEIHSCATLEELAEIIDIHYDFIGDMSNDAQNSLERFKHGIQLHGL